MCVGCTSAAVVRGGGEVWVGRVGFLGVPRCCEVEEEVQRELRARGTNSPLKSLCPRATSGNISTTSKGTSAAGASGVGEGTANVRYQTRTRKMSHEGMKDEPVNLKMLFIS